MANTSFFSRSQRILDPAKAVSLLGVDLVRSIVLTVGVIGGFSKLAKDFSFANAGQFLANGQTDIEELDYPYLERLGLIAHLGNGAKPVWSYLNSNLSSTLKRAPISGEAFIIPGRANYQSCAKALMGS